MRPINDPPRVRDVVAIGASAGGIPALQQIFASLPENPPLSVAVVLHRSPHFVGNLPGALGVRARRQRISEPNSGTPVERGQIYVAPRDVHMVVEDGHFILHRGPKQHFTRPAIDPLFQSLAREYGERAVGVVLTGGGEDGTDGLTAIGQAGGIAVVQNPEEARNPLMPLTALGRDHVQLVLSLDDIAPALVRLAEGRSVRVG